MVDARNLLTRKTLSCIRDQWKRSPNSDRTTAMPRHHTNGKSLGHTDGVSVWVEWRKWQCTYCMLNKNVEARTESICSFGIPIRSEWPQRTASVLITLYRRKCQLTILHSPYYSLGLPMNLNKLDTIGRIVARMLKWMYAQKNEEAEWWLTLNLLMVQAFP